MTMNDESWHAVRNITGVTGFVGPGSRPTPLSDEEVEALNIDQKRVELSFKEGDSVEVISGLFEGFSGVVQSISEDFKTVTVLVKKGRRDMPVELDATELRRVD
jgi:transcriptional antiterminator NusG